jgi:biotin synthase
MIQLFNSSDAELFARASEIREKVYGKAVFLRGLIELSSYCANDCYYCGLRKSNAAAARYRLSHDEMIDCCERGYALGLRTFVLQGGEDAHFCDARMTKLVSEMRARWPDCAVTLSLGERSRESYQALYDAGAERYLLRHETANAAHYATLHPSNLSFERRMRCLHDLRDIGYQVGCGFLVGSPGQTEKHLEEELAFLQKFQPQMVGIGPFLPHKNTPFAHEPAGSLALTLRMLAMIRIMLPRANLPATTALGTLSPMGRIAGLQAGANVLMPNLSPAHVREKYQLYDGKLHEGLDELRKNVEAVGYEIVIGRGDPHG